MAQLLRWRRRAALLLAVPAAAACARMSDWAVKDERTLVEQAAGDVHLRVTAERLERTVSRGFSPSGRFGTWEKPHTRARVQGRIVARRGGDVVVAEMVQPNISALWLTPQESVDVWTQAQAQVCASGQRFAVHLWDRWHAVVPLGDAFHAVDLGKAPPAPCAERMEALPPTPVLLAHSDRLKTCDLLRHDADGFTHCFLRGKGDREREPWLAAVAQGEAHTPDLEAALYRVLLEPRSMPGLFQWDDDVIAAALGAARSAPRRLAFVHSVLASCSAAPLPHWRRGALEEAAGRTGERGLYIEVMRVCGLPRGPISPNALEAFGVPALCDDLLRMAESWLGTEGVEPAARVMSIINRTADCATDAARGRLARRGLERPSLPVPRAEMDVGCDDTFYPTSTCDSLPRWAGSWLARHCDPASIAVARRRVTGAPRPLAPRYDEMLDGALRVLARCSPKDWRSAVGDPTRDALASYHNPDTLER